MTPPAALTKALKAHDAGLRARWAKASQQWFIEERMAPRHPDFLAELRPPADDPVAFDRYESLQAGYYPRFTVPRESIYQTERVMASLRQWDAATVGSFAAINRALDEAQAQWQAARKKERDEYTLTRAEAAADHMLWQAGHRLATGEMAAEAETSDAVERRDGFVIRTRKGLHAEIA